MGRLSASVTVPVRMPKASGLAQSTTVLSEKLARLGRK
jgi:hypothetical protein